MTERFQVIVRCKPSPEQKVWRPVPEESRLEYSGEDPDKTSSKTFSFAHVFCESTTHCELYDHAIAPRVTTLLDGQHSNLAVIAYGDASGGKTQTVFGTTGQTRVKDAARGVIYRCGQQLLAELQQEANSVYHMSVSFCHIFEDGRVADLFDTKKRNLDVIVNQSTLQYSVPNLTQQTVATSQDVLRLVEKGYLMRNATGCVREPAKKVTFGSALKPLALQQYRPHCTHAVFTFTVEYKPRGSDQVHVVRATIVDLAGKSINELFSLSSCSDSGIETLNKVVTTLSTEGIVAASSLFNKSSLTKLLKPCFGGNCATTIVANLSLSETSSVTRGCLRILSEAQKIKNFSKKTTLSISQSKLGQYLGQTESRNESDLEHTENNIPVKSVTSIDSKMAYQGNTQLTGESQFVAGRNDTQNEFGIFADKNSPRGDGRFVGMVRPRGSKPPLPLSPVKEQETTSSSLKLSLPKMTHSQVDSSNKLQNRIHQAPPSPLFISVHARNRADSMKSEQSREEIDDSSDDSLSLDSDGSADLTPVPVQTGPPPPPLRGIPHFNPNSPLSSQLTSLPLIPGSMNRPTSASSQSRVTSSKASLLLTPNKPNSTSLLQRPVQTMNVQSTGDVESISSSNSPLDDVGSIEKQLDNQLQQAPRAPLVKASIPKVNRTLFPNGDTTSNSIDVQNKPDVNSGVDLATKYVAPTEHVNPSLDNDIKELSVIPSSRSQLPKITQVIPSLPKKHLPVSSQTSTKHADLSPVPMDISTTSLTSFQVRVPNLANNERDSQQMQEHSVNVVSLSHRDVQANLVNVQRSRRMDEGSVSDVSDTSSSLTISSDSEELSDEARDHFNPNMQRRVLQMQSISGGHHAHQMLPILPPISPPSHGSPLHMLPSLPHSSTHTTNTHGLATTEHLPSYSERNIRGPSTPTSSPQRIPLPIYNSPSHGSTSGPSTERSPRGVSDGVLSNSPEGGAVNLSQYMSSDEIHVAAMEGVRGSEMKRLAIQFGVDYRDHGGRTPLMYAVLGNQPKMCEVLIKLRASIDVKDSSALTPLLWATYLARAEVMRVLLKNRVGVHCTDSDGRTAYHWAMKTPNVQCLKWLCKYANFPTLFNKPDNEGLTPLHWAVMSDQASHIRLFLSSTNADVSIKDRESRTPLNYAVLNFSPACIRAILECRENAVNLTDNKGRTALHYACAEGSADCVRTLLSFRSCDLHCTDNSGTTPLHWAAAANQPGLVQLLLRRGADRGQRDNNNMSPLEHAQQRGHNDCIKILQTYGLRRPGSALSIASRVSLPTHAGDTPTLDEQGHVVLRRPNRRISLSGVSVSSMDRLPADGQAGSEDRREEGIAELASLTHPEEDGVTGQTAATNAQRHTLLSTSSCTQLQPSQTQGNRRSRWSTILCCSARRSNVVAPM